MTDIERIALFHLEFEGIHPFIDGNGRTGRLILNLDLIRNGYPPINVKFTDRKRYYDAFDAFYKDNDATPMTELIAEYINLRFSDYFKVLEKNELLSSDKEMTIIISGEELEYGTLNESRSYLKDKKIPTSINNAGKEYKNK